MNWKRIRESKRVAESIKAAIVETSSHISDETMKLMPLSVFAAWKPDTFYETVGEVVVYEGVKYRITQSHTSQANWLPSEVPALYNAFATVDVGGDEIEEWQQTYAHNAYMKGKRVLYKGQVWESLTDNNSWSPDDYPAGWMLIDNYEL